jgi:parvulin-like peptidyl-prolyl isomerase
MLLEKLVERDVNEKVHVTNEEAERYFEANSEAYTTTERLRVAQIVLPDRKRAERTLKRLKEGEDFGMVAKEVSISPDASKGGDLGYLEQGILPEAIDRMVFKLPVGQISRVAKSPYGFHIFKVLEKEEARKGTFTKVRGKVMADLKKQKETEAYRNWIEDLKLKAVIRISQPIGTPFPKAD